MGVRPRTDTQTHTQTHRHTDTRDHNTFCVVYDSRKMYQYNKGNCMCPYYEGATERLLCALLNS